MSTEIRPTRFKKEKKQGSYVPEEGSWESVLVGIRDELPENVHVVNEADHFIDIDSKATMNLKEACFQYYLAGKGHKTLAEMVINSNKEVKTSFNLGGISKDEKEKMINDLASFLYDSYPESYRVKIQK